MLLSYPLVFRKTKNKYVAEFPDIPEIKISCRLRADVKYIAVNALKSYAITILSEGKVMPPANSYENYMSKPYRNFCMIKCEIPEITDQYVNLNMVVPKWLIELAQEEKINISQVFEEALYQKLKIYRSIEKDKSVNISAAKKEFTPVSSEIKEEFIFPEISEWNFTEE